MDRETKDAINNYINGVKHGDRESLNLLYNIVSPSIRHIALKYLKNDADADDLVQDFWADIYKISLGFVFMQNGFSYLCRVMTRRTINRYHKLHREKCKRVSYVDYESSGTYIINLKQNQYKYDVKINEFIEKHEQLEMTRIIDNAINKLSETEKIIIQLVYFQDKTVREIAKELKISKSHANNLKLRAIEKLKSELSLFFVDKNDE